MPKIDFSALLNAGMNRLVNRLPSGDSKMKFIPQPSNADFSSF
jgi:hypothetical protein